MATVSGRDAWAAGLIALLPAVLFGLLLLRLLPAGSDVTIIGRAKGNSVPMGYLTGGLAVLFFTLLAVVYLMDFINFMDILLPRTPTMLIGLLLMLPGAYAVRNGPEVLARSAELVIIPIGLFILLGSVPNLTIIVDIPMLWPLDSIAGTVKGSILQLSSFGEIIVLGMLLPITDRNGRTAAFVIAPLVLIWVLITLLIFILYGNFGPDTVDLTYKLFELYRNVARIDSLFIPLWVMTFFIKLSVFLYAAARGLSDTLELGGHQPLVFPLAMLILPLSLFMFTGATDYMEFFRTTMPYVSLSFVGAIIILFLLSMYIGGRTREG